VKRLQEQTAMVFKCLKPDVILNIEDLLGEFRK
jgi:hypothetical protein